MAGRAPDDPPGTTPPSHRAASALRRGAGLGGATGRSARRSARALLSPRGVRGTALEVAWIGAHLALYPLGALRDKAHLDRDLLGSGLAPAGPARVGDRRRRGRRHPDPAGARHGRQPLDLHASAPWPAASRVRPGPGLELQPDDRRRPARGGTPADARRAGVRGDRLRAPARRRALDGRDGRALLRPATGRRPTRPHARDARHAARRDVPGAARSRTPWSAS